MGSSSPYLTCMPLPGYGPWGFEELKSLGYEKLVRRLSTPSIPQGDRSEAPGTHILGPVNPDSS